MRIGGALAGSKNTATRSPAGMSGVVRVRIVFLPTRTAATSGAVSSHWTTWPRGAGPALKP
jgi:hypothetical protein